MRVSGIKGGAPRAPPLPQDLLYAFSGRCILSGAKVELLLHAWYKHIGCRVLYMRLPESPASARLAVPIIDARLSSEYSDAYSASQCIDRRVGGGLCVSKLEARAWLSVRVPPSTPVCLVRVATTGSKSQQASLARGFRLSVGNNTYGDEAGNCTDGDVRVQPSGLPGPFDIPCDACPVGEFVTLRHLGPQPDHLALSELAVFTRKGHTPAADESEFRRTCNADPAARVAAVTARFAAAAAELRRAADNCTEHFRHLAEHSARAWLSQCIASSTAVASPNATALLSLPRYSPETLVGACKLQDGGRATRCAWLHKSSDGVGGRLAAAARAQLHLLHSSGSLAGIGALSFLISKPIFEPSLSRAYGVAPLTLTPMGDAEPGLMPVLPSLATPAHCDCRLCAREACSPSLSLCAQQTRGDVSAAAASGGVASAAAASAELARTWASRRPAALFVGSIDSAQPVAAAAAHGHVAHGAKSCRVLAALEILAMHDDSGQPRGHPHRSTVRFGSSDVSECRRTIERVGVAILRGADEGGSHATREPKHSPARSSGERTPEGVSTSGVDQHYYPNTKHCPRAYSPLQMRLRSDRSGGPPYLHGAPSEWLSRAAEELCAPPISPTQSISLSHAHAMQLELPGDSRFSAPSTICSMAGGAVRVLDPRILTAPAYQLAGVPRASQHAFRFASPCELDAIANASAQPLAGVLAAASRRHARVCLGAEFHSFMGAALHAFAVARKACGADEAADAVVKLILRSRPDVTLKP